MKYQCLVVDDEAPAHKVLASHIAQIREFELSAHAFNGQEALTILQSKKIDIVFLDIEMPKLSGIELLDCLPYKPIIILTTAYSNYGYEAYQKDVFDYLLKPISFARFLKTASKLLNSSLKSPINLASSEIEIKHDGIYKKIKSEDILYIESIGNYIKLHFYNDKPIMIMQTLKYFESLLVENHFIRIHRSYLVKKASIITTTNTMVTLVNNKSLPIGRKYSILLELTGR